MGSGKPGIHMDQVSGARPAPHNLPEKAEDHSRIKLESQASHA